MEELDFVNVVYSQNLIELTIVGNAIDVFLRWITTVHGLPTALGFTIISTS
jgi:hypothetical protein